MQIEQREVLLTKVAPMVWFSKVGGNKKETKGMEILKNEEKMRMSS
jgi:hypothetical protein